ncbi:amidase [Aulographum hederae CBS 113979]|uniref:Amidase n=1 Tax=Aulographum hederae CBS 113979 TaxID=1176131 RepID=A0A6G1HGN7_9PEZI|nr:amidase [Aulographum hederae CBS 113979]
MAPQSWQSLSASKRSSNLEKIPKEWRLPASKLDKVSADANFGVLEVPRSCGILTAEEITITEENDATDLLEKMAKGELKSVDVTRALCKRAAIAQQLVNCLTEIFFEEALERAKTVDEYFEREGKVMGPLHGLPISLKDSFNVKGQQATIGYVQYLHNDPATSNSTLVDIMLSLGAVPYVKTNLPQTMMTADSENNVFGRTLNPHKLSLTAGGSTGGEGALIAMRGSLMGIGTDIAGSVRIPALCDGIFGFKPCSGRIPFGGKVPPGRLGAPTSIFPTIGPEAHSIRDMELWLKSIIDTDPWVLDEGTLAVPWREVSPPNRPLRLGLLLEDPSRPLHPSIMRSMTTATEKLKEAGHAIVPLSNIPDLWAAAALAWKFFLLDPTKKPLSILAAADEPLVLSMTTLVFPELKGYAPSLEALFEMNIERRKIMKAFHDMMTKNELDAFVMPAYQATAVPHDQYGVPIYTVLPNLIDYPAASIPYLKANQEADMAYLRSDVKYEPPYVPEEVEDAPCGFQVVGRPMRDEELMETIKVIWSVLGV